MARLTKPLTDTEIKKSKAKEKDYKLQDGQGLFLLVKSNGSKLWRFRYLKPITGKQTELSLGAFPDLSLIQARALRQEFRELIIQGVDPQQHRQKQAQLAQERASNTFLAIAEQWREKKAQEVEALTLLKNWRRLEIYLLPYFAEMPICEISPALAVQVLTPLSKQGKGDTLKRTIRLLNEILSFAVVGGVIPFNPCQDVKSRFSFGKTENNPTIRPEELADLIKRFYFSNVGLFTRNLFLWQLLTMTRPSEAAGAEWAEIDFNRQCWIIPAEKMKRRKAHVIPLSSQALRLLDEMRKLTGGNGYIFPSLRSSSQKMNSQTLNKTLRDLGYTGRLTAHGLRSIASTHLNEQLINYDVIEACLSHGIKDQVRKAYNRSDYLEQRKPVMQLWGDYVEKCGGIF